MAGRRSTSTGDDPCQRARLSDHAAISATATSSAACAARRRAAGAAVGRCGRHRVGAAAQPVAAVLDGTGRPGDVQPGGAVALAGARHPRADPGLELLLTGHDRSPRPDGGCGRHAPHAAPAGSSWSCTGRGRGRGSRSPLRPRAAGSRGHPVWRSGVADAVRGVCHRERLPRRPPRPERRTRAERPVPTVAGAPEPPAAADRRATSPPSPRGPTAAPAPR